MGKHNENHVKVKFEAEKGAELKQVEEITAVREKIKYSPEMLVSAIEDVALEVNNAYFRHPFKKCPSCYKNSLNAVLAHFGAGGKNKIGNLKGFQATVGDVIAWTSDSYKGMSIVKGKNNGVFELETSPFEIPRKEAAIVERVVIPEKYRNVIAKMTDYKAGNLPEGWAGEATVAIGRGEYPNVIKEEL